MDNNVPPAFPPSDPFSQSYGQPPASGVTPVRTSDTLGIASIILAFVLPVVGLILGVLGLKKAGREQRPKTLSVVGIGLSVVFALLSLVVAAVLLRATLEGAQSQVRDTERQTEVDNLKNKLDEFYKNNGYYPSDLGGLGGDIDSSALQDPGSGEPYRYTAGPPGCTRCTNFTLRASLAGNRIYERSSGDSGGSVTGGAASSGNPSDGSSAPAPQASPSPASSDQNTSNQPVPPTPACIDTGSLDEWGQRLALGVSIYYKVNTAQPEAAVDGDSQKAAAFATTNHDKEFTYLIQASVYSDTGSGADYDMAQARTDYLKNKLTASGVPEYRIEVLEPQVQRGAASQAEFASTYRYIEWQLDTTCFGDM